MMGAFVYQVVRYQQSKYNTVMRQIFDGKKLGAICISRLIIIIFFFFSTVSSAASNTICVPLAVNLMNDHELEIPVIGILLFLVHCQTLTLCLFNHQNIPVTQTGDTSTNYFVCTTLVYLLVVMEV